jgi:hypothetical protein
MADDFYRYDLTKTTPPGDRDGPGTVKYYQGHAQCLARINKLTDLLNEIAAECAEHDDASIEADGRAIPNCWMRIHLRIREVVPR